MVSLPPEELRLFTTLICCSKGESVSARNYLVTLLEHFEKDFSDFCERFPGFADGHSAF